MITIREALLSPDYTNLQLVRSCGATEQEIKAVLYEIAKDPDDRFFNAILNLYVYSYDMCFMLADMRTVKLSTGEVFIKAGSNPNSMPMRQFLQTLEMENGLDIFFRWAIDCEFHYPKYDYFDEEVTLVYKTLQTKEFKAINENLYPLYNTGRLTLLQLQYHLKLSSDLRRTAFELLIQKFKGLNYETLP